MRTVPAAAALTLGAAFISVGVAIPAHAQPDCAGKAGVYLQECLTEVPPQPTKVAAANNTPCGQSAGSSGITNCADCLNAIRDPDAARALAVTVQFDCGSPGAPNPTGAKPHCMVGEITTNQPGCSGNLGIDGKETATN
jgi:hypothetical protein